MPPGNGPGRPPRSTSVVRGARLPSNGSSLLRGRRAPERRTWPGPLWRGCESRARRCTSSQRRTAPRRTGGQTADHWVRRNVRGGSAQKLDWLVVEEITQLDMALWADLRGAERRREVPAAGRLPAVAGRAGLLGRATHQRAVGAQPAHPRPGRRAQARAHGEHALRPRSSLGKAMPRLLQLFNRTGSIGRAFREAGLHVTSLDLEALFQPSICCDILRWDFRAAFPPGHFDMVWASPVCTEYSRALTTRPRRLEKKGDRLVLRALEIIAHFDPSMWILENSKTEVLKSRPFMQRLPFHDVTYCSYGFPWTRLWTNMRWQPSQPVRPGLALRGLGRRPPPPGRTAVARASWEAIASKSTDA